MIKAALSAIVGVIALITHCRATATTDAPETLLWATMDSPPFFIADQNAAIEGLPGGGIGYQLLDRLIKAMPDLRHEVAVLPLNRILNAIRHDDHMCFLNSTRSAERDSYSYSVPFMVVPEVALTVRVDMLRSHPEWAQGVRLAEIIRRPDMRGQYLSGRTFGPAIAKIIAEGGNLQTNTLGTNINQLRMVAGGRISYSLDDPVIVQYRVEQGLIPRGVLVGVPIIDADHTETTNVMCPRTPWGFDAIHKVDAALRLLAADQSYRELAARWIGAARSDYRADVEQFLKDRTTHSYAPEEP